MARIALMILLLPQQEAIRINTELVILDAQVLNKKTNTAIGNLKSSDFELFEDGVRQEITHFSVDKLPLSIVLLLDVSPSVKPFIDQIGMGALEALQRLRPDDEVSVMAFAGTAQLIQGFTTDRQLMAQRIQRLDEMAKNKRGTNILLAINEAAKMMKDAASPINRRVIITVTDNESYVLRGQSGTSIKETLDNLFESGSAVCGLVVRGAIAQAQAVMRWSPSNLALLRSYKVDPFVQQTGGEMMNSPKSEVDRKLGDLFEQMRARYTIGFSSTNTNYDGKFRNISLKLSSERQKANGDLTVRTRRGYYARRRS
jgi:VWFA-related protein